jgi:hypothetical protein
MGMDWFANRNVVERKPARRYLGRDVQVEVRFSPHYLHVIHATLLFRHLSRSSLPAHEAQLIFRPAERLAHLRNGMGQRTYCSHTAISFASGRLAEKRPVKNGVVLPLIHGVGVFTLLPLWAPLELHWASLGQVKV